MVKEIRCVVSPNVVGVPLTGTWVKDLWDMNTHFCVVRLDRPFRIGEGATDYVVALNRDIQFIGHH